MNISSKDLFWSYLSSFFKIASSILILPIVLRSLPSEQIAFWVIFSTITSLVALFDFGFGPSFTRNISYVFSGSKEIKSIGFETVSSSSSDVDYSLLKQLIVAMKFFYFRLSIIVFFVISIAGTIYIQSLLLNFKGSQVEIYLTWFFVCITSAYSIYSSYYESLLLGKGMIMQAKKIQLLAQILFIFFSGIALLNEWGISSVFIAQLLSLLLTRYLLFRAFFTPYIKKKLESGNIKISHDVLNKIKPNSVKVGITTLGGFLVTRSAVFIGAKYLTLDEVAMYGISVQIIRIISILSSVTIATYLPKIVQLITVGDIPSIKAIYIKAVWIQIITFSFGALFTILCGNTALEYLKSETHLLPPSLLFLAFVIFYFEANQALAGNIILTSNEVPFFKASLFAGLFTVVILFIFLEVQGLGVCALILAPGIANIYNNVKWPHVVSKQLDLRVKDFFKYKTI